MLIGYARVSKNDGSQTTDLQKDALIKAGIQSDYIYQDLASGRKDGLNYRNGANATYEANYEQFCCYALKLRTSSNE